MIESYFVRTDEDRFVATNFARGPWDTDFCHAGPAMSLLIRAVEGLAGDTQLVRLTTDILRPIPMAGFNVRSSVVQSGKSVIRTAAEIYEGDRVIARSIGVHIRHSDTQGAPTPDYVAPTLEDATDGPFALSETVHSEEWFATSVECRYAPGSDAGAAGPITMWMRNRVPIVLDEEPSPFQNLGPIADCANGTSQNGQVGSFSFVNVDVTLTLLREPVGDWFASQAISHWQPNGIGITDAEIFDQHGPVGRAAQAVMLRRTPQGD